MDRGTLAGVGDLMQIHLQPVGKRGDMGRRLLTQRRQIVLDMRRYHRIGSPAHQTIAFQPLQGLRQHLFADTVHFAAQLTVTQRAIE